MRSPALLFLALGAVLAQEPAPPAVMTPEPAPVTAEVLPLIPAALASYIHVAPLAPADFVARVDPGHPRLLLTPAGLQDLQARLATDPVAQGWLAQVRTNGEYYLRQTPIAYVPQPVPGERAQVEPMLWPGRSFVDRIMTLGLLARLEPQGPWYQRLHDEIFHAITWTDWGANIARYEIACGFALAYDWCHEQWTAEERSAIEDVLSTQALEGFQTDFPQWTRAKIGSAFNRNNVNLVNNAGAGLAALALAHEKPDLAGPVLARSFALMQVSLMAYGADGMWYEGMNYWRFASRHLAQYGACLISATGSDLGLMQPTAYPGIARTASWALQLCAPSGRPFDFADGDARPFACGALLWLGWQYGDPTAIQHERRVPFGLATDPVHKNLGREVVQRLLYDRPGLPTATFQAPLDGAFSDGDLAVLRSAWGDPEAAFVGIKAGTAEGNRHAHLDAGTIIAEVHGRRWLAEIGPGPYEKRYFGADRYRFFQARTEGHGTLILDPQGPTGGNHDEHGRAVVTMTRSTPAEAIAVVDLAGVHPGVRRCTREVTIQRKSRQVVIHDQVESPVPVEVRWQCYTPAPNVEVAADGRSVRLAYPADADGPAAQVRLVLGSSDARQRFTVEDAAPLDPAKVLNPGTVAGYRRLAINLPAATSADVRVTLEPGR